MKDEDVSRMMDIIQEKAKDAELKDEEDLAMVDNILQRTKYKI